MIASSVKGKAFVFAVFLLGIVAGALVFNVYETRLNADSQARNRRQQAEQDIKAFHDYLGLNDEQRKQVRKIMDEQLKEFRELAQQTRPQYDSIREQARNQIKALLTDEQKRKYDEYRAKQLQQLQQQRGQRGPRPKN
jgi:Spy/CpxP family protein refolding chaperone